MAEVRKQSAQKNGVQSLDQVGSILKSDVSNILRDHLPVLQGIDTLSAYNTVLDQPEVLDASFKLFRSQPDLFSDLLVDQHARPVTNDHGTLRCGRSISDIIALVVQAAAKRYFKRKLPIPVVTPPPIGKFQKFMISMGLSQPPPKPKRPVSRADKLFEALRDRLIFEWQALMIPTYTTLTPQFVSDLGAHLLLFRVPGQLLALAGAPDAYNPRDGLPPLMIDSAQRLLTVDGVLNTPLVLRVAQLLDLEQLFPTDSAQTMVQATTAIEATSASALNEIMLVLGEDSRLFVTFLYVAYVTLGAAEYGQFFGKGALPRVIKRWMDDLDPVPQPIVEEMKAAYIGVLQSGRKGIASISAS